MDRNTTLPEITIADPPPWLDEVDQRTWQIARTDVLANLVDQQGESYFTAGATYGGVTFTRDIAFAAISSLNRLLPEPMWSSLQRTRRLRRTAGLKVPVGYQLASRLPTIAWQEIDGDEQVFIDRYVTGSYARRTDDVIWLWAAGDLLLSQGRAASDQRLAWLIEEGEWFFRHIYDSFFDQAVGLYRGQACFVDVHFLHKQASAYPQNWTSADCIGIFAASTNALYIEAMRVLCSAAEACGLIDRADYWSCRRDAMIEAFRDRLLLSDGSVSFMLHADGRTLEPRNDALGTALAVLLGVLTDKEAETAVRHYPITPLGVPLFSPNWSGVDAFHNNSAWPFVEDLLLQAMQIGTGQNCHHRRGKFLRRSIKDDSFHEIVDIRDGRVFGSAGQLWTAAAYLGWCLESTPFDADLNHYLT